MSTSLGTPTQRVPAWKRLGLKLKGAASDHSPASADHAGDSTAANANASAHSRQRPNAQIKGQDEGIGAALPFSKKRKQPPQSLDREQHSTDHKHRRQEDSSAASKHASSALKTPKSVRFANGTHDGGPDKPGVIKALPASQTKSKGKKAKKRKQTKANGVETAPKNIDESLKYLRLWDTDRKTWKFNKNHQTLLLKYVFEEQLVPSADISTFYKYVRTVAGFARARLREIAQKTRDQDMEQGTKAFPATVKDAEAKQVEYEHVLTGLLAPPQQDEVQKTSKTRLKRPFDEAEFVIRTADADVRTRAVKRIRAEIILDELSDSEESSTSSGVPTTPTTTTASNDLNETTADASGEKRTRLNDGIQKKVRRRKLRVALDDDTSESDSDSDSSSSSSSSDGSSSDSDESDEEEGARVDGQENDAETSSSSSSSSSGSESGTDDESASVDGDPGREGKPEAN